MQTPNKNPNLKTAAAFDAFRFIRQSLAVAGLMAIATLGACGKAGSPYERAEQHAAKGELFQALRETKAALIENAQDLKARLLLARLLLKASDPQGAQEALEQAITQGAQPEQFRELRYDILQAANEHQKILDLLEADTVTTQAHKLLRKTSALAGLGRKEEAMRSIDEAAALAPADAAIQLARARLYVASERNAEASEVIDALLKQDAKLVEAWWLRGVLLLGENKNVEAYAALTSAVGADRGQLDIRQGLMLRASVVELALTLNKLDEAERGLRQIVAANPEWPVVAYLGARLDLIKNEPKAAVAKLDRALRVSPDQPSLRLLLGTALIAQGANERGEAELNRLIAEYPDNIEARKQLARSYLANNRAVEARKLLAAAPASATVDAQSEYLLGASLIASGQLGEAIQHLEKSAAAQPGNTSIGLDLATAYIADGARDKAIALLDSLPRATMTARRRALRLFAEVVGRNRAQSDVQVAKLLESNATDASMHEIAATYFLRVGDEPRARELLKKAIVLDPKYVGARLRLASLDQRQGDLAAAASHLSDIVAIDAKNEIALLALASLAAQKGDNAKARKYLEDIIGAHPGDVQARLALAEIAFGDRNAEQAHGFLNQAVGVSKDNAAVLNAVGEIHLKFGERDAALARFNEAAAYGLMAANLNIAKVFGAEGRFDEARRPLETALEIKPLSPDVIIMLAELDAREGKSEAALRRVEDLKKINLPAPLFSELQGDIQSFVKRFDKASQLYDGAFTASPSSRVALKQFQVRRLGKLPNAITPLTNWLQREPNDSNIRFALGSFYQDTGDRAAAIKEYERGLAAIGKPNPAIINNLAWMYHEQKDARALDLAKQAYTLAPRVSAIADTYGWILVANGKFSEAEAVLEQAAADGKANPEIAYHLAVAQARTGHEDKARATLAQALKAPTRFTGRAEAEQLVKTLNDSQKK